MTEREQNYRESLSKARAHLEKSEYKNARLMYFQAYNNTENNKNRAIIWAEVSWVYYYEKNYEKAIEASENVFTTDPEYKAMDDVNRMLGFAYLGQNNLTLAEKYLLQSLTLNETDDKQHFVRFELGKLYFIKGRYDLAFPQLMGALDYFKAKDINYYLSLLFYLGFVNYYLESLDKARTYFEQILTLNPDNQRKAGAFFGLAFLDFRAKNFLNVIGLCEKIIEYDDQFFDRESVGFLTAASYFYLGRKDIFLKYHAEMSASYPNGRYNEEMNRLAQSEPDAATGKDADAQ